MTDLRPPCPAKCALVFWICHHSSTVSYCLTTACQRSGNDGTTVQLTWNKNVGAAPDTGQTRFKTVPVGTLPTSVDALVLTDLGCGAADTDAVDLLVMIRANNTDDCTTNSTLIWYHSDTADWDDGAGDTGMKWLRREIQLPSSLGRGAAAINVGDVTGDGRVDIIIGALPELSLTR